MAKPGKLRIYARGEAGLYEFAVVDWLDGDNGILLFFHHSKTKLSRHSDGRTYERIAGSGHTREPELRVPFSQISREVVKEVRIPSDLTYGRRVRAGPLPGNGVAFPASVLASATSFAAEVVDNQLLESTVRAWHEMPACLSLQTWQTSGFAKTLVLTVLSSSSTT